MNAPSKIAMSTTLLSERAMLKAFAARHFVAIATLLAVSLVISMATGCTVGWWYPKYAKPISIDGKELTIMKTTVGKFVYENFEVIRTNREEGFYGYESALGKEGQLSPSFGAFVEPGSCVIDPSVDEVVEETPALGDAVYMLIKDRRYYGTFSISLKKREPLSEAVIASYKFEPMNSISVEEWPEIIWEGYDIRDITPEIIDKYTISPISRPPEDYLVQPHGSAPSNPRGASNGLRLGDMFWTEISFSQEAPDLIRIFEIYMR